MSELKSFIVLYDGKFIRVYKKTDADKVIAEKDKEIARLDDLAHAHNIELLRKENLIAELKNEIEEQKRLRNMALASVPNVLKVMKIIQHHKYKRCLAMAEMCDARHDEEDTKVNGHGASWDYTSKEMKYWERWHKRWLAIAEKFKPNSTINIKEDTNALQR